MFSVWVQNRRDSRLQSSVEGAKPARKMDATAARAGRKQTEICGFNMKTVVTNLNKHVKRLLPRQVFNTYTHKMLLKAGFVH